MSYTDSFLSKVSGKSMSRDDVYRYSACGPQGHPYYELIRKWYDPHEFLEANPDLQVLLKSKFDYEALFFFFLGTGFYQRRIYSLQLLRSFDADYYRKFLDKDVASLPDDELKRHWLYEGIFKGYAGSKDTDVALNSPFQVFNMGRIGSHSITSALAKCGFKGFIQTHSDYEFSRGFPNCCLTFSQLMELRFTLDTHPPLFIISGVRDPINWVFSSFRRLADAQPDHLTALEATSLARVIRGRLHFMLNFFKDSLLARFNVFGNGFDAEAGYRLYEFGRHKLLIYRVDRLDELDGVIGEMIGSKIFKVEHINKSSDAAANVASDFLSAEFYKEVFNDQMIEALRTSDYMRHFYTKTEQFRFSSQLP